MRAQELDQQVKGVSKEMPEGPLWLLFSIVHYGAGAAWVAWKEGKPQTWRGATRRSRRQPA